MFSGTKIYDVQEINSDIDCVIEKIKKTNKYSKETIFHFEITEDIRHLNRNIDKELIIEDRISPKMVKVLLAMLATKELHVISAF